MEKIRIRNTAVGFTNFQNHCTLVRSKKRWWRYLPWHRRGPRSWRWGRASWTSSQSRPSAAQPCTRRFIIESREKSFSTYIICTTRRIVSHKRKNGDALQLYMPYKPRKQKRKKIFTVNLGTVYRSKWMGTPVLLIRDVYTGSGILIFTHSRSRIQKQKTKERGEKKLVVITSTNFTKLKIILVEVLKKKIWANFQKEL